MPPYLSTADVAAHLGVSTRTVRALITTGQLPAAKVGREYRVSERAVREFVRAATTTPQKNPKKQPT